MLRLGVLQFILVSAASAAVYDVIKFGADHTGVRSSTDAITRAINEAAAHGGGMVRFPPGKYLTGPLELKSNIIMDLSPTVVITWLDDPKLYPPIHVTLPDGKSRSVPFTPLLRVFGQKNVTIKGKAILDGQGPIWWERLEPPATRPIFINFFDCHNIVMHNITIRNSPMFNVNILQSSDVVIKGITIDNPPSYKGKGPNTDGINLSSVRRVHIDSVSIATGDDCVAINASGYGKDHKPTYDVLVENSRMSNCHGGVSIGSITVGGLRNITVRNCIFDGTIRGLLIKTNRQRGGVVEDIHYYNVVMNNCTWEGICITDLYADKDGSRKPIGDKTPFIRNIQYDNISGSSARAPIMLVGVPEAPVENIVIRNTNIASTKDIILKNTKNIEINGRKY